MKSRNGGASGRGPGRGSSGGPGGDDRKRNLSFGSIMVIAIIFGALGLVLWERCVLPGFSSGSLDFNIHASHQKSPKRGPEKTRDHGAGRLPNGNYAG